MLEAIFAVVRRVMMECQRLKMRGQVLLSHAHRGKRGGGTGLQRGAFVLPLMGSGIHQRAAYHTLPGIATACKAVERNLLFY